MHCGVCVHAKRQKEGGDVDGNRNRKGGLGQENHKERETDGLTHGPNFTRRSHRRSVPIKNLWRVFRLSQVLKGSFRFFMTHERTAGALENNEYPRIKWTHLKKQVSNTFCEDCSDGAAALPSLSGHGFVRHWDRPRAAAVLFGDPLLPPKPTTSSSLAIAVTESLVSLSVKSDGPTRTDKRTVGRLAHYGFLVRNIGCETDRRAASRLLILWGSIQGHHENTMPWSNSKHIK